MSRCFANNGRGDVSCRGSFGDFRKLHGSSRTSETPLDIAGATNFQDISLPQAEPGLGVLDLITDEQREIQQRCSPGAVPPFPVQSRSSAPESTSRSKSEVLGWNASLRLDVVSRVSNCTMSQREEMGI